MWMQNIVQLPPVSDASPTIQRNFISIYYMFGWPNTAVMRPEARTVSVRSNAWILGWNSTRGMDARISSLCVGGYACGP
jgi:hypothetical protein